MRCFWLAFLLFAGTLCFASGYARADMCSDPPKPDLTPCDDANPCTQLDRCQGGQCVGKAPVACTPVDACHAAGACNPAAAVTVLDGTSFYGGFVCAPSLTQTVEGKLACDGAGCARACGPGGGILYSLPTTPGVTYVATVKIADYLENCQHALHATVHVDGVLLKGWQGTGTNDWAFVPVQFTAQGPTTSLVVVQDSSSCCACNNSCNQACNPLYGELSLHVDAVTLSTALCTGPALPNGTGCSSACTVAGTCQGGDCQGPAKLSCPVVEECHAPGQCNPKALLDTLGGGEYSYGYGCNPHVIGTTDNGLPCGPTGCGYVCSSSSGLDYTFDTMVGQAYAAVFQIADYRHNCQETIRTSFYANGKYLGSWTGLGTNTWSYATAGFVADAPTTVLRITEDNDAYCWGSNSCNPGCSPLYGDLNLDVGGVAVSRSLCSSPPGVDGAPCDDGDLCTQMDTCQDSVCAGTPTSACVAQDDCHDSTCDPATGACLSTAKADGAPCDDGNGCTTLDRCKAAVCVGINQVDCSAPDTCHEDGTCSPATGLCDSAVKADGTPCNDGNACTEGEACQAGICAGAAIACETPDDCHEEGTCNPATGACELPAKADGTPCPGGACEAGECLPEAPDAGGGAGGGGDSATGGGASGGFGAGASGGFGAGASGGFGAGASGGFGGGTDTTPGAATEAPAGSSTCGCRTPGGSGRGSAALVGVGLLGALGARRLRAKRPRDVRA